MISSLIVFLFSKHKLPQQFSQDGLLKFFLLAAFQDTYFYYDIAHMTTLSLIMIHFSNNDHKIMDNQLQYFQKSGTYKQQNLSFIQHIMVFIWMFELASIFAFQFSQRMMNLSFRKSSKQQLLSYYLKALSLFFAVNFIVYYSFPSLTSMLSGKEIIVYYISTTIFNVLAIFPSILVCKLFISKHISKYATMAIFFVWNLSFFLFFLKDWLLSQVNLILNHWNLYTVHEIQQLQGYWVISVPLCFLIYLAAHLMLVKRNQKQNDDQIFHQLGKLTPKKKVENLTDLFIVNQVDRLKQVQLSSQESSPYIVAGQEEGGEDYENLQRNTIFRLEKMTFYTQTSFSFDPEHTFLSLQNDTYSPISQIIYYGKCYTLYYNTQTMNSITLQIVNLKERKVILQKVFTHQQQGICFQVLNNRYVNVKIIPGQELVVFFNNVTNIVDVYCLRKHSLVAKLQVLQEELEANIGKKFLENGNYQLSLVEALMSGANEKIYLYFGYRSRNEHSKTSALQSLAYCAFEFIGGYGDESMLSLRESASDVDPEQEQEVPDLTVEFIKPHILLSFIQESIISMARSGPTSVIISNQFSLFHFNMKNEDFIYNYQVQNYRVHRYPLIDRLHLRSQLPYDLADQGFYIIESTKLSKGVISRQPVQTDMIVLCQNDTALFKNISTNSTQCNHPYQKFKSQSPFAIYTDMRRADILLIRHIVQSQRHCLTLRKFQQQQPQNEIEQNI